MDMTETTLNTLDQCLAISSGVQELEGLLIGEDMTIRQIGGDQMDRHKVGLNKPLTQKKGILICFYQLQRITG